MGEAPQEDEATIRNRVETWRKGKGLRALLFSLHEVAPPGSWQPVLMSDVQTQGDVKSVYRKAMLAMHPDKQCLEKESHKIMGHLVFQVLREEWDVFRQSG